MRVACIGRKRDGRSGKPRNVMNRFPNPARLWDVCDCCTMRRRRRKAVGYRPPRRHEACHPTRTSRVRDRERRGFGESRLPAGEADGQSIGRVRRRSAIVVRHGSCSAIAEELPLLHTRTNHALRLVVRLAGSRTVGDQVASRSRSSLLALGGLCARAGTCLRVGFSPQAQAA